MKIGSEHSYVKEITRNLSVFMWPGHDSSDDYKFSHYFYVVTISAHDRVWIAASSDKVIFCSKVCCDYEMLATLQRL